MQNDDSNVDLSIQLVPMDPSPVRPSQSRRFLFYLLVGGAVSLSVLAFLAFVVTVARLRQDRGKSVSVAARRDPTELRNESAQVYSSFDARATPSSPESAAERQQIDAFFRQLEECTKSGNNDAFRELVDFDRLLKRIELTGSLRGWSNFDKRSLRTQLKTSADTEPFWTKITIAGIVTPSDDPDSRVVYTYCERADTADETEDRFWLARDGDAWKIYDWERLDLALTTSNEWAIYARYVQTPQIAGFDRWGQLLGEFDTLAANGDLEAAKQKLRASENELSPAEFQGFRWVVTGHRWMSIDEVADAERCYRKVDSPIDTPGAHFGLMNCAQRDAPATALEHAEAYERAVGPSIALLTVKAELLEELGRKDEASQEWLKILKIKPDNSLALSELFLALPVDDKSTFEQQLERVSDKDRAIVDLATTLIYNDYEQLLSLVEYVRRTAPRAPSTFYVAGLAETGAEQHDEAARLYRQAFEAETNEDSRNSYISAYVEAMVSAGKVSEALETVPDPKLAFSTLTMAYDEAEISLSKEEYRTLVKQFRERFPNELDAINREAQLAIEAERYDEAEQLLRPALERAAASGSDAEDTDYIRSSLADSLTQVLYKLGKFQEAFQAADEKENSFAQLTRLAIAEKRWDDVRWLLDQHRQQKPDDPHLHFVEGRVAVQEKQWDKAVEHFRAGASSVEFKWPYHQALTDAYLASGRWQAFFATSSDPREDFGNLAKRFINERDWDSLDALLQEYRRHSPAESDYLQQEAEAAWEREDYAAYVAKAEALLAQEGDAALPTYQRQLVEDQLFSALVRSNQLSWARLQVKGMKNQERTTAKLAILEAALGDFPKAEQLALKAAAADENAREFYHDETVGRVFLGDEFAKLHAEFPISHRYDAVTTVATALYDRVPQLDVADIAAALHRADIRSVDVTPLKAGSEQVDRAYCIDLGESRLWLATGKANLDSEWKLADKQSPLADLLKKSQGRIAVGASAWTEAGRRHGDRAARKLLDQLMGEEAIALYVRDHHPWVSFAIYPATDEILTHWRAAKSLATFADQGATLIAEPKDLTEANRKYTRELRAAVKTFESTPGSRLEVVSFVKKSPPMDPVTLNVTSVKPRYGGLTFEGTLNNTSQLLPELNASLPMRFEDYEIHALRINGGETVVRPR